MLRPVKSKDLISCPYIQSGLAETGRKKEATCSDKDYQE